MGERCKSAHAKLLAGTCPWCGRSIVNRRVAGEIEPRLSSQSHVLHVELHELASLERMVIDIGPLECDRAARFIEEVARDLTEMHDLGQLHGGVRPDNIFIDEAKTARLGPRLGMLTIDEESSKTASEQVALSLVDYLAPELALTSHQGNHRADIYSLGCTFYYLLTGRAPFPSGTISERLLKHQTTMPEPIGKLRPDVPVGLVQICNKMLAKKPIERYQTPKEVAAAIVCWLGETPQTDVDPVG